MVSAAADGLTFSELVWIRPRGDAAQPVKGVAALADSSSLQGLSDCGTFRSRYAAQRDDVIILVTP